MKLTRILNLVAGAMLAGHLSSGYAQSAAKPVKTTAKPAVAFAPVASNKTGFASLPANHVLISTPSGLLGAAESEGKTISLTFPAGTQVDTLRAVLNGKDVSSRFTATECATSGYVCATGSLSDADGVRAGKNVLFATVKKEDGTMASSRLRFAGSSSQSGNALRAAVSSTARPNAVAPSNGIGDTFFTPPAVAVKTLTPGGWNGNTPWIAVGNEQLPSANDTPCAFDTPYVVVVLDRQTLQEVSGAARCLGHSGDSSNLTAYLKTLTSDQIVIVGTTYNNAAVANLDTSAIGGVNWSSTLQTNPYYPVQYMTIGVGGAQAGSAFENYFSTNMGPYNASANGTFAEDANGNYNFQPSDAYEYIVDPHSTNRGGLSTVTLLNVKPLSRYTEFSYPGKVVFTPPPNTSGGYWLLILERDNLDYYTISPNCGVAANDAQKETDITSCGTFYPTGPGVTSTARKVNLQALSTALNNMNPNELAFLVSMGTPSLASRSISNSGNAPAQPWDMANNNENSNFNGGTWADNGYMEFAAALNALGAPDKPTLYLGDADATFAYVTALGIGNSLSGHSVLSSSVFSNQGQTGYVHGVLTRNLQGFFQPGNTKQEKATADSADFSMDLVNAQQPVSWPEFTAPILPGASSLQGQENAYAYLSWYLLNAYYVPGQAGQPGVSAPYAYDIHYFFTGSLNTYIDIHTFDPLNAIWPGAQGFSGNWNIPCKSITTDPASGKPLCTWVSPTDQTTLTFTTGDFSAVQTQMHNEIVDLTNVLLFLVDGSTNMKDITVAGNANTALALLGAASEVMASINQPTISATPATVSPWNIVNMVGSFLTLATTVPTDGLVSPETAPYLDKGLNVVADLFGLSGTVGGGITPPNSTSSGLPSQDLQLFTTIGDLANSGLQGQMLAGFDTVADGITGDWGKLNTLGPKVVDPNNTAFFFPNQVLQNASITVMNQAEQRSLYLSLIPQFFQVQMWPMCLGLTNEGVNPNMAYNASKGGDGGNPFYTQWDPAPANSAVWYPTYGGYSGPPFPNYASVEWFVDWYMLAEPFQNVGASDTYAPWMSSQLATTLFTGGPSALNFSFDQFVAQGGPMQLPLNGKSAFADLAHNLGEFTGHQNSNIVAAFYPDGSAPGSGVGSPSPSPLNTITTLQAPTTAYADQSVAMQATVVPQVSGGPVPTGTVQFRDGSTILGTGTLDATGNTSYTATGLGVGTHSLGAYYISNGNSDASNSAITTLTVYATDGPNMTLSLSAQSVNIAYGSTSPAVTIKVGSLSGLSGNVAFTCSGLPVGMSCNFNPATPAITTGGTATTSLTVTATAPTNAASMPWFRGITGLLILPVSLLLLGRIRKGAHRIQALLCLIVLAVSSAGLLTGCGGGSKQVTQPTLPSGPQTILVSASTDTVTKSIPLTLNIQ